MTLIHRYIRAEEGVAAVEFAFVAVPVLWLLLGIAELAVVYHLQSLVILAADEGARRGKTGRAYGFDSPEAAVRAKIQEVMKPWFGEEDPNFTVTCYSGFDVYDGTSAHPGSTCNGDQIGLYTVTYTWHAKTPILMDVFGEDGEVPIVARALVKNERWIQ